jgi:hypothetical protein
MWDAAKPKSAGICSKIRNACASLLTVPRFVVQYVAFCPEPSPEESGHHGGNRACGFPPLFFLTREIHLLFTTHCVNVQFSTQFSAGG